MKRPLPRKRPTPRKRPAARCAWSNRCKRRPSIVIDENERLCRTHATWTADKLVGDYVKARDRYRCWNCGETENLQWAHILSRGARYVRWDPRNAVTLDSKCHQHFTLKPAVWAVWLEDRLAGVYTTMVREEAAGQRSGHSVDIAEVIRTYRAKAAA